MLFPDQSASDVFNPPPGHTWRFRSPAALQWRVLYRSSYRLFERIQGWIVCKVSDETFSKLRITWAYIKLLCIPQGKSEARMVSLARIGNYEVRMFERSRIGSADAPLFWMELFDHHTKRSIDSCSCHEIEDAVALFQEFISQAKCSNEPSEGSETQS